MQPDQGGLCPLMFKVFCKFLNAKDNLPPAVPLYAGEAFQTESKCSCIAKLEATISS